MSFILNSLSGESSWCIREEESHITGGMIVFNKRGLGETLFLTDDYFNQGPPSALVLANDYIINGLLLNNKWPKIEKVNSDQDLLDVINQFSFPRTPQEKLDNLFEFLFKLQTKDGEELGAEKLNVSHLFERLYFKDYGEYIFYLKVLAEKGMIQANFSQSKSGTSIFGLSITFSGLEYYNLLTNEGLKSKNCFIAMSFGSDMIKIREVIKSSCEKTGFTPILIDEVHADADKTINDEIIASIKKSKFCIADFTEQRDGVYFESGYALGRGLKVIYTCQDNHFKESHFDTNHFPHIIYSNPQELEQKLINKIEAWIKD